MKATKYTYTITIEVLSKDTIRGILYEIMSELEKEKNAFAYSHDDGDSVSVALNEELITF